MTPTAVMNASESDRCMMTVRVEVSESWQGTSYASRVEAVRWPIVEIEATERERLAGPPASRSNEQFTAQSIAALSGDGASRSPERFPLLPQRRSIRCWA
jgi:hypothetical protein